jgi:DNA-binding PadR family transcriptional regulator
MKLPSQREMELLSLIAAHERSGREVAKLYEQETGRAISYGTLYTTFRRMKEHGWVTATDDVDGDGRVRYFNITRAGLNALDSGKRWHHHLAGLVPFPVAQEKV